MCHSFAFVGNSNQSLLNVKGDIEERWAYKTQLRGVKKLNESLSAD